MKRNSGPMLLRDLRREIARTAGRFISITVIVALGVAFFVGLRATGPDMRQSADGYFDRQQMMDLELLSTLGFTQEDVQALQAQTGVEQVQPGYQLDALVAVSYTHLAATVLVERALGHIAVDGLTAHAITHA